MQKVGFHNLSSNWIVRFGQHVLRIGLRVREKFLHHVANWQNHNVQNSRNAGTEPKTRNAAQTRQQGRNVLREPFGKADVIETSRPDLNGGYVLPQSVATQLRSHIVEFELTASVALLATCIVYFGPLCLLGTIKVLIKRVGPQAG